MSDDSDTEEEQLDELVGGDVTRKKHDGPITDEVKEVEAKDHADQDALLPNLLSKLEPLTGPPNMLIVMLTNMSITTSKHKNKNTKQQNTNTITK